MTSQAARKLRTRKALMDGALEMVAQGHHFSTVSIREVAKKAGVTPNAFYRHFQDMDELALAIVDELGLMLRQLMRQARQRGLAADTMITGSVDFFFEQVHAHPQLFRFQAQCVTGGSEATREAIRNEMSHFAHELVLDLNRLKVLTHIDAADFDMIGHLVVNTVASTVSELLDLPADADNLIAAVRHRTIRQLRLVFLGADAWRSNPNHERLNQAS